MAHIK